jgi:hypothetical protein
MLRPYLGMELELARARAEWLRGDGERRRPARRPRRWRVAVGARMVDAGERPLQEAR